MSDSIKGLDALLKKLDNLPKETAVAVLKQVKKEGKTVQARAKLLCPVSKYGSGGELRDSIKENTDVDGTEIISKISTVKNYGPYVELGTGPVGQSNHEGISPEITPSYTQEGWTYFNEEMQSFVHTKGQPAQPYLYPALKDYEKQATENIKSAVKKTLNKVARK